MRMLAAALLLLASSADARRCVIEGQEVNPDNGATTAGKTGILTCHDDDGRKQYEHEYRNGEHIGLERSWGFDGSLVERRINANGNTEGLKREFWPDGTLKSEGEYVDGDATGLTKAFHKNGRLAALRFHAKPGASAVATIEYDDAGRLRDVRCAARSVMQDDRALCGWGGKTIELALHDQRGRVAEKRTLRDGVVLKREGLDPNGRILESVETTASGHVTRRYHDNGELAYEAVVENDWRVAENEWYMNGAVKSKIANEPGDDGRSVREYFRDTGVPKEREEWRNRRRMRLEKFDERGTRTDETLYAEEGHAELHRELAPDGTITLEEELYPDGSRKVVRGAPKVSAD
jgi:antitoxin component YwqK of YwqJK toxin-antitoxin module